MSEDSRVQAGLAGDKRHWAEVLFASCDGHGADNLKPGSAVGHVRGS